MTRPTIAELDDFVAVYGAKLAALLLNVSSSAIYQRLNRSGIWVRGKQKQTRKMT